MSANLPPQSPPAVTRPWWAALLTSAVATLLGLGLVLLAIFVVEPAIAVGESNAGWQALLGVGLTLMSVGGSVLAQLAQSLGSSQRGHARAAVLWTIAGLGLALAGAAFLAGGCAGSQYIAQRRAVIDWSPGPPCHLAVLLDDDGKAAVTVDAPEACEPPPDVCPVAPAPPAPAPQS